MIQIADDAKKRKVFAKLEPKIGTVLDKAENGANTLDLMLLEITGFLELENIYADLETHLKAILCGQISPF